MVNCVLNKHYHKLLTQKNVVFRTGFKTLTGWSGDRIKVTQDGLGSVQKTGKGSFFYPINTWEPGRNLSCCGITEIYFEPLQQNRRSKIENNPYFDELVAKYIDMGVGHKDERIVIAGIPREVGNNSQYHIEFYNALYDLLLHIGFLELPKTPYKNANSGNKLTVLVGQIPELHDIPILNPHHLEEDALQDVEDDEGDPF